MAMMMRKTIGRTVLKYLGASSMVAAKTNGTSSMKISMTARILGSAGKVFVSAYSGFLYFTLSDLVCLKADV